MRAVAMLSDRSRHPLQCLVAGEGPEKLKVAFAGLVHAGEDRIHDAKRRRAVYPSARNSIASTRAAVGPRRRLERADDRRSDGDNPPAVRLRSRDCRRGPLRDAKRLVEGELRVQRRISGRGEAGGVGQRSKSDAAPPPDRQRAPMKRKAGRGRFECDRVGRNSGPDVPQRQRLGDVRVLDRRPVPGEPGEDGRAIAANRSRNRQGGSSACSTTASSGPSARRSPAMRGGGGDRSSVRVR